MDRSRNRGWLAALGSVALWPCVAPAALAQEVVPSQRVSSRVVVRAERGRHGDDVGSFLPGDRAKLVNRTAGEESDSVATGIDGSFYGEIPLAEGSNEIEIVALLYGGTSHRETLAVEFEPVAREQRMAEALDEIRRENAALIETLEGRLRAKLAEEITARRQATRAPDQDKELEVSIEGAPAPAAPAEP